MKTAGDRMMVVVTWTLAGAALPVVFVCGFLGFSHEVSGGGFFQDLWAGIVADFQSGLILAGIGAAIGFIVGLVKAVTGGGRYEL